MNRHPGKALLANIFGSLGYIAILLLWAWTGIVYIPLLLENSTVEHILLPSQEEPSIVPPPPATESPLAVVAAVAVAVFVILLTVIVFLRAPVTIAKTGKTITSKAAESTLPIITKRKPLPKNKKKLLTAQLIKLMKLALTLLPLLSLPIGFSIDLPLPAEAVALVSSLLAGLAIFWFSLQYIGAKLLKIDPSQLV